jgi:hypothetical protein
MKACQEAMMEACLEKTEVEDLEANPEEVEFQLEHSKVPEEEAAALENRRRDQHLAVGRI